MHLNDSEEALLRSTALPNAQGKLLVRERAKQEAQAAQNRVASLLESITDAFFALDHDWRFTYINHKGAEMLQPFQSRPGDLLGRNLWEEFPGAKGTEFEAQYRRAMAERVPVSFQATYGSEGRWFEVRVYPSQEGLSVYFHDITEQWEAETKLLASAERLRAMFNQAAVGISIASIEGQLEEVNHRFCEILGYTETELRGKTGLQLTHPADVAVTEQKLRDLLAGAVDNYVLEKRYLKKNGDTVWSLTSVTLLRSKSGEPDKLIGVVEDITQRKLAEQALQEGTQRFQLALAAGRLGDWSWDAASDRVTMGPEAYTVFGIEPGSAVTWDELGEALHPGDRDRIRQQVKHAIATATDYDAEYRVRRGEKYVWVAARGRPLYQEGRITGMIGVVQDITQPKEAEEIRSRLAAVVESSDEAIISMDLDTIITTWNRGAERMFGYTAAEAIGRSVSMLIPEDSEDDEPAIIQKLLKGERVDHYETVRIRKDGTLLTISLTVSPIYDAHGRMVGASKIARDITGLKEAEEIRSRLAAVVESSDDAIISMGLDTIISTWNKGAERMFGYTAEEAIGRSVSMLIPEESEDEEPKILERLLQGERIDHYETVRARKDGTRVHVSLTVSPVHDARGNIIGVSKISRDITQQKEAETTLEEERELLETLNDTGKAIASQLELAQVAQTAADAATKLSGARFGAFFYNAIRGEGESSMSYALAGAPREAFEPFQKLPATPLFNLTFRGEPPVRCEDVMKDPRFAQGGSHHGLLDEHFPLRSFLAVPVISRTGAVLGGLFFGHPEPGIFTERAERLVVGVAAQAAIAMDNARLYAGAQREITERKRVEEALREAQEQLRLHAEQLEDQVEERTAKLRETIEELEAFSYSVSHDMRSPLRAMQGYSEALLEDYQEKLDETAQDYLNRIRRSSAKMDLLIQDVLAYSRVAKGEVNLRKINVEHLIQDVILNYPGLQPETAHIQVEKPIPPVLGHEAYLTQVISNLLNNAVKFVPSGVRPEIRIKGRTEGEMVRLDVVDNGIGIAPEHQSQIFQIFGRVYPEKAFEGTGIGLAIVRKATERMGGAVEVESEVGKGSRFSVLLKKG